MANSTTQNAGEHKSAPSKTGSANKRKASLRVKSAKRISKSQDGLPSQIMQQGRKALNGAYDSAAKVGRALPTLSGDLHLRQRSHSVYAMMEERPLVMGAVGLGVGIVLATLLPSMSHKRPRR